MRVHIGADHAAFDLKKFLVQRLERLGHDVVDHGPATFDPDDDYPVYIVPTAQAVLEDPGSLGVVLGGSGNGEQIAANKVKGIRAALAHSIETATLARQHNNAQIVSIGSRMTTEDIAGDIVEAFVATPFSGDPRHQRRIDLLEAYEQTGQLPG